MISDELRETADALIRLVSKERTNLYKSHTGIRDDFHSDIRDICHELLATAGANGEGGCLLCQS